MYGRVYQEWVEGCREAWERASDILTQANDRSLQIRIEALRTMAKLFAGER